MRAPVGHPQRRRAPRGQRARRRGAVGAGKQWHQGEQETLAAIIEHRRAGLSWAKVADKLNATGHRTPHRRPVDAPGRPTQAREREHGAAA